MKLETEIRDTFPPSKLSFLVKTVIKLQVTNLTPSCRKSNFSLVVVENHLKMVLLHVKKADESQFLYETTVKVSTDELLDDLLEIYNGRLKISRVCYEIEELSKHGTHLPPNMVGLNEDQIEDLKLIDEWGEKCIPSGGFKESKDEMGKRNGKQPLENMGAILEKTVKEVQEAISKKLVAQGKPITKKTVLEQLDLLRGACTIVYPMGLPPHDPIRMEFEFREELGGTQDSLHVIFREEGEMWFCGKQIFTGNNQKLGDFIGKNEKTKVVVKLQRRGGGAPAREPLMTEEEQKALMMYAYRKQEEHKKLAEDEDDSYMNSDWADKQQLKRHFQGLRNINWKPK